jgi:hypothetical protein
MMAEFSSRVQSGNVMFAVFSVWQCKSTHALREREESATKDLFL